jgi:L-alanine-DL-glutamate epimerase-like enolase superfamily enzyme
MTAKLRITGIIPYPVWVGMRNQMLVKVETDQDVIGWGESDLSGGERAVAGVIEHYREFLIGREPMQIGRIWQETYRSRYFEGGRVLQVAISANDIALHDIKGEVLGVPVYELLGGNQRNRVPTFASTWDEAEGDVAIERGIHQFNRIDVCNVGWLTEAMKVAGWSEAHYVDLMPHNPLGPVCTAASVHLAAAVSNFAWPETRAPETKLRFDNSGFFTMQPRLDGADYPASDLVGLGVEANEAAVRAQSLRFWEAPHLRRRHGSVTNW